MRLSAPVYRLKRNARLLSRAKNIPLHEALERIAAEEGFSSWSLLVSRTSAIAPGRKLFARLIPGELVLVGARPGHGKTLLSLELVVEAMKAGHRGVFFTLEYTEKDILERFRALAVDPAGFGGRFEFHNSDGINAGYIVKALADAPRGTLAVVDYLQLLDQKRENPELAVQVRELHSFARDRGLVIVFISQIDRSYDPSRKPCPDIRDVRLPNPVDLTVFGKTCFLQNGDIRFGAAG